MQARCLECTAFAPPAARADDRAIARLLIEGRLP
jgi:hypothetical protein